MRCPLAKQKRWAAAALLLAAAAGCATYGGGIRPMLDQLARGDPSEALSELERSPREDDALYHLERGMLLRLVGRLRESSLAFDEADRISEDLYTKSVSQEAAALAVSDRLRSYRPPAYERLLARHYQIRNYLEEGDGEGALVEARRCEQLLNELQDEAGEGPFPWIPAVYLGAALAHESAGRADDALRLYRRLFADGGEAARQLPPWIPSRMHRLARRVGVAPEELPVPDPGGDVPPSVGDGRTAVIWLERGLIPERAEFRLRVPILESEARLDPVRLGPIATQRALGIHAGFGPDLAGLEISYWLEIALPRIDPRPLAMDPSWVVVQGERRDAAVVAELGRTAGEHLDSEMPSIVLRTLVRALIKYGATRGVEKKTGEIGGILANVLGAASERAETRMWLSLPGRIDVIAIDLGEGDDSLPVGWGGRPEGSRQVELKDLPGSGFSFGSCRDLIAAVADQRGAT